MYNNLEEIDNNNDSIQGVFSDLSEAFDAINHDILKKLIHM